MSERKGFLRYSATIALLTLALAPMHAWGQRAELEKIIQRKLLPNGLEVIVVENHGVPLATIEFNVKNGSFTQTPEYEGLAHMYEHMFFKADQKFPEPNQFWDRASEIGAIFNGTTREENVNYYLIAFKDHSIYSAFAYWVEADTLHYVTPQRVHNQVSINLVDRDLTDKLNRDRQLQVKLPK